MQMRMTTPATQAQHCGYVRKDDGFYTADANDESPERRRMDSTLPRRSQQGRWLLEQAHLARSEKRRYSR